MPSDAYHRLLDISREISALESVANLLSWDQQTYMPPNGFETRAAQKAIIARLLHEHITSNELSDVLDELSDPDHLNELGEASVANVRELRRIQRRQTCIPARLVKELEHTSTLAFQAWKQAREQNSYSLFAPWLEKLIRLTRERIAAIGYDDDPYDVLLQDYEPGLTSTAFQKLTGPLRDQLKGLLAQIQSASQRPNSQLLQIDLDAVHIQSLGREIAVDLGFDLNAGRIDNSVHPFCSGQSMHDVRVTSYFNRDNPLDSLFAIVHEVGHGMYHQGLPPEHQGTPLGKSNSLAVHESQARWWENFIARSLPFWERYYPRLQSLFPDAYGRVTLDEFFRAVNQVQPSAIRVEADEVTYNLHVLLRVELEAELVHGSLSPAELPDAWDTKMEAYLGLKPQTLAQGVLQDVHWSRGLFGYFATYLLGNILAAQWHHQIRIEIPDFDALIRQGRFQPLLSWMRLHVHRHGSRFTAGELVSNATGNGPDATFLMKYLSTKYGQLYRL